MSRYISPGPPAARTQFFAAKRVMPKSFFEARPLSIVTMPTMRLRPPRPSVMKRTTAWRSTIPMPIRRALASSPSLMNLDVFGPADVARS